jgi:DNA-binding MarR family transcriptional regulator
MAGKRRLTQADYRRLAEFRYHLRRFLAFSEQAAGAAGLAPQQHQALLAIKGFSASAMTAGALAQRLGIKHHSAVGLIDRLVANGLAVRRPGADDRRQVLIALTPKAEGVLAKLSLAHRDELERLAPLLKGVLASFEKNGARKTKKTKSGGNA